MSKIALLHFAYPPNTGGVEVTVQEHARLLQQLGYDVTVVTGSGEEKNQNIHIIVNEKLQSVLKQNQALYEKVADKGIIDEEFYSLSRSILDFLETTLADRDVVIVHNMLTLLHNVPFIHAFKQYAIRHPEKRIIVWIHDHTYIGFDRIRKDEFKLAPVVDQLITEKILNATYVAISLTLKNLLLQVMSIKDNDIKVIHNGIDIKKFLEINDSIWNIFHTNNFLSRFPIFLSPVNILDRKNIEYCIDVVAQLKRKYPEILYIITGNVSNHRKNNQYYERLQQQIISLSLAQNVFFFANEKKMLAAEEIHDVYSLSDAVLFFSKSENFGLPLIEAYLSKTPLFISDLKVFHEIADAHAHYIDIQKEPQFTAQYIENKISHNDQLLSAYRMRTSYNLLHILKTFLIPLLH